MFFGHKKAWRAFILKQCVVVVNCFESFPLFHKCFAPILLSAWSKITIKPLLLLEFCRGKSFYVNQVLVGCFKHATSMQAYCGGEIYYTRLKAQAISFREDSSNQILGVCLEGKSMTHCHGHTVFFCSFQQCRLRFWPLKGFLSDMAPGKFFRLVSCDASVCWAT